ncbi:hypothetical protein PsAD2_00403 [Pseudovibrio axinellae]|uniref:Uncharacterized protein n=1 Tax=Pseudovibrio axinellae TaxID=989403 RepID=A0A161V833_9HYPH|nr:hypothetical protein [Pseudovibrio axinellae]KZL21119.1 hypothetical protein PsAD2_00403 [Pseudovibrio axinellae]SEQ88301.1 hypothetical protein SAMN05421798_1057 [Pseudovibrio axinellae]
MRAIERVNSHYKRAKNQVVEVPEWGEDGAPFKVFYDPMTPRQRTRISGDHSDLNSEAFVDVLIMKSQDETGELLFNADDKHKLLTQADGAIIGRVALQMLAPADAKVLEKN